MSEALFADVILEPDVAKSLGVTTRTLRRWHRKRTGPPRCRHRFGRSIAYPRSALQAWINESEGGEATSSEKLGG